MKKIMWIQEIKGGDLSNSVCLFEQSQAFICSLRKLLGVPMSSYDDYNQLCYLAMLKACSYYDVGYYFDLHKDTFNALWKKCILREYLSFKLKQDFVVSIPFGSYVKKKSELDNLIGYSLVGDVDSGSDLFFELEQSSLSYLLWYEVQHLLCERDYYILSSYYRKNQQLVQVARQLGMTPCAVRNRKIRALRKLRNSPRIKILAKEYYGIGD